MSRVFTNKLLTNKIFFDIIYKLLEIRYSMMWAVGVETYNFTHWRLFMKKINTVFTIDRNTDLAIDKINIGAEWVFNGEGTATVKFDGSSCMIKDGILYKRWNRKISKPVNKIKKACERENKEFHVNESSFVPLPVGAIACNESFDPITYHWPHWVLVNPDKENKYHNEAFDNLSIVEDGTYEICGSKLCGFNLNLGPHIS